MAKNRGLGRGLDSLIPAQSREPAPQTIPGAPDGGVIRDLPVERVKPSPGQPRRRFDAETIDGLARSIKVHGLIQLPVVREKNGFYELIAGERRFRAVRDVLGWKTMPALVKNAEDAHRPELALVENLQRDDLNDIEVALAYQELQKAGLTHERIAERVGVSRVHVTNTLRLLDLPDEVRRMVAEGLLRSGSARAILRLDDQGDSLDPLAQLSLAKQGVAEGWSTRKFEQMAAERGKKRQKNAPPPRKRPGHIADLEERLLRHLDARVRVEDDRGKGRIIIEYHSVEDAQRLLQRMGLPVE